MLLFLIFVSVSCVTMLQLNASSVNIGLWIERCGTIGRLVQITVGATTFLPIKLVSIPFGGLSSLDDLKTSLCVIGVHFFLFFKSRF